MSKKRHEYVPYHNSIIPVGGTDRTSREENRFKSGIENFTTKQSGAIWKERTKEYERMNKKAPVEIKRLEDL